MKCSACGKIVRKDHGQLVAHACAPVRKARQRTSRERIADRETQYGRYLDCGPAAWDDR